MGALYFFESLVVGFVMESEAIGSCLGEGLDVMPWKGDH